MYCFLIIAGETARKRTRLSDFDALSKYTVLDKATINDICVCLNTKESY